MVSERRYMVYGIGNGIVDKQDRITDAELEALALPKGHMELADQAEQAPLPSRLAFPRSSFDDISETSA